MKTPAKILQKKWAKYLAAHLASKQNVPGAYEKAQKLAREYTTLHDKLYPA